MNSALPPDPLIPPPAPQAGRRVYAEIRRSGEVRLLRTRPHEGRVWQWPELDAYLAAYPTDAATHGPPPAHADQDEVRAFRRQLARTHLPMLLHLLPFETPTAPLFVEVDVGMGTQWVRATGR